MADTVETVRTMRDDGSSLDEILAHLRGEGHSVIGSIRVVRQTHGLSLAQAKWLVLNSPAWADHKAPHDAFVGELLHALGDEVEILGAVYGDITEHVSELGSAELARPSRCAGWTVGDVLYHQLLDARRALVTFASPADGEPDVDEVTYWRAFTAGDDGSAAHAQHVRSVTAAYPAGALGREWRDTAAAAVRAARSCPYERVTTQGHVLRTKDFVSTLVFEATIHHLDMTGLPTDPGALGVVRRVLDGLLGGTVDWDDRTYALKGTGRDPLTDAERAVYGERFPLTG